MAVPNINQLLQDRERRIMFKFTHKRIQHGDSSLYLIPNNVMTGDELNGFVFGRDIWGVGIFSEFVSKIGEKYNIG